jgi:capsular polysaccharide transport system permease protein
MKVRTSWQITKDVYYALFMREMVNRLFERRFAWFWLFVEPILFVLVVVGIRTFIKMADLIAGAEIIPWTIVGLVSFFMFRDGMMAGSGAVGSSKALFAYRQLKPIDAIVIRVLTLGLLQTIVFMVFILGMLFLGFEIAFPNLVAAIGVFLTLWGLGLGIGLILAVAIEFVRELQKIVNILTLPLMILSGAFLPLHFMPYAIQEILLLNPTVHAIELIRLGIFEGYWTLEGVNYTYLLLWTLGTMMLGIAMNIRFEMKLKAK